MLTGLIFFALFIAWDMDILLLLYNGDKSRISWMITLLYLLVTFHCARRFYVISDQINAAVAITDIIRREHKLDVQLVDGKVKVNNKTVLPDSYLAEYIHDLIYRTMHEKDNGNGDKTSNNMELIEVYESRLKKPHDIGWFVADLMIKLGLLGTIIGFVLMLGSVVNVTDFDVTAMQNILKHMSSGMGTALYTTFAGLVCSILAGVQYHILDHGADEVLETAKHLTHVYVLPKLT